MRQTRHGTDPDPLTTTLERLEPEFRETLVGFHVPAQDAEDPLQDVLLVYLVKRDEIASPRPWLLATLRNRCLKYWRSRRRRLIEAVDESLLEELAGGARGGQETRDLRRDLSSALSHLPDRCRSILRLRYGLECGGDEIAERLGYKSNTVRQATLRCLSALSSRLLSTGYAEGAYAR